MIQAAENPRPAGPTVGPTVGPALARTAGSDHEERARRTGEIAAELAGLDPDASGRADRQHAERLRRELVLLNIPAATRVASRFRGRGEPLEDLIQTAHLGLVKAAQSFDPRRGTDFLAYAVPTISGELKKHFRDLGWDIRPPRRIQELRGQVERTSSELTQELGRAPRLSEIATRLAVPAGDVAECVASADLYRVGSLDAPVAGATTISIADGVGAPDPGIEMVDDVVSVQPLLAALSPRERRILGLRYYSGWTQQQIAEEVGLSQMHVSRLLARALQRLREGIEAA